MNPNNIGARLVLAAAVINLLFHLTMLAFNIIGVPMGLAH